MILRCPANIEVLMHYHCTPDTHPKAHLDYVTEITDHLLKAGAIESDQSIKSYRTTELGAAWVKLLCNTPIPTTAFVDQQGNVIK